MSKSREEFIEKATLEYGAGATMNRKMIRTVADKYDLSYPFWLTNDHSARVGRGRYKLPLQLNQADFVKPHTQIAPTANKEFDFDVCVPAKFEHFIPFGFYEDLKVIVSSKAFFPVFISGLSGNGKTLMVEQVCAELGRECVRVNISRETDESDLIGSKTLVDGNIEFHDGPVLVAMKRGAILLIDEVDRGSDKLMCLQAILEGKPYFNKKTGEVITAQPGFNVVATANSKGRGSEDGKYLSQILDDAFLERFVINVDQDFPDPKIETKILKSLTNNDLFVTNLIKWAEVIRKSFEEGAIDDLISTRRLVHIVTTYNIFKEEFKAIELCTNRFPSDVRSAFMDLYVKVCEPVKSEPVASYVDPKREVEF